MLFLNSKFKGKKLNHRLIFLDKHKKNDRQTQWVEISD